MPITVLPKFVKHAPCQEKVILAGEGKMLDTLPLIQCWPKDGGKFMPVEGSRPVWLGTVRFGSRVMPRASRAENYRIGCLAQIESSVADLF